MSPGAGGFGPVTMFVFPPVPWSTVCAESSAAPGEDAGADARPYAIRRADRRAGVWYLRPAPMRLRPVPPCPRAGRLIPPQIRSRRVPGGAPIMHRPRRRVSRVIPALACGPAAGGGYRGGRLPSRTRTRIIPMPRGIPATGRDRGTPAAISGWGITGRSGRCPAPIDEDIQAW